MAPGELTISKHQSSQKSPRANPATGAPQKSVSESWSKQPGHLDAPDRLISRQTNPLEPATYRFVFHYSSGIREWNLILMTERETGRDGKFEGGTLFPHGWFYKQVGADATGE